MSPAEPTTFVPRAWRRRSRQLAAWTFARLVNRTDVWGAYVAPEHRESVGKRTWTAPPAKKRGQVKLHPVRLMAHFAAQDLGHVMGLHAVSPAGTCRWGAIDIDRHGGPGDPSPEATFEAARFWFELLVSLGFSPLLTDSNGTGGYHLLVAFDEPTPVARAYWFLRWVVADHHARGLPTRPETYPRAAELPPGGFGNWLRLPGRHHTHADHWSRAWDGERWFDGDGAIDLILATAGDSPLLIPPAATPPKKPPAPPPVEIPADAAAIVKRCQAYVAKMPDAISGQRGHDRTFHAACECFRFGLDDGDARALMDWFNANKTGGEPWSPKELEHKLAHAKSRVSREGKFGIRLRESSRRASRQRGCR